MARIAFYAPLKPPDHPVPSGDREMARNLLAALQATSLGPVELVSDLRLFERRGDREAQTKLITTARDEVDRLISVWRGRDLRAWVTYHNYYKAPDLIGPAVCAALGLAYVQIESTRARSRLYGPWHRFAEAAHKAADAAQVIFYLTQNDRIALDRDRPSGQCLTHLPPFLGDTFLAKRPLPRVDSLLLSVGMMREGDKMASYKIIAETLALLDDEWQLDIAGDGPAHAEVKALMAPFGSSIRFLGELDKGQLQTVYSASSLLFWPGVNEAFGMVYLEAQAAGLPVVAQDRPGVRDVLSGGPYPAETSGPSALADRIRDLRDPTRHAAAARAASSFVAENHLLSAAANRLRAALQPLIGDAP
ncbi:MAG: glycosyltransferase family 4 protein [Pseudomonadota bacterium]